MDTVKPREATKDAPIGGQAVLEGVMMRGISTWAVAVRKPSAQQLLAGGPDAKEGAKGEIEVMSEPLVSWSKRHRILRDRCVRENESAGQAQTGLLQRSVNAGLHLNKRCT